MKLAGVQKVCNVFRKSFIESTQTWYYTTRMNIFFNTLYEVVMLLGNNDKNSEFPDQIWGSGALNTLFLLALQPAELSTTRLMRINLGSKTHLLFKFQVVLVRTLPHPWIYLKRPFLWLVFLQGVLLASKKYLLDWPAGARPAEVVTVSGTRWVILHRSHSPNLTAQCPFFTLIYAPCATGSTPSRSRFVLWHV